MKISIVTTILPLPGTGGGVRIYELAKNMEALGNEIQIVYLYYAADLSENNKKELTNTYRKCELVLIEPRTLMRTLISILTLKIPYLDALKRNKYTSGKSVKFIPDIIQFSELNGYYALEDSLSTKAIKVLDSQNVDHLRLESEFKYKSLFFNLVGRIYVPLFRNLEVKYSRKFDYILACSRIDAKFYEAVTNKKVEYVPNGVSVSIDLPNKIPKSDSVIFMGLLSYFPNQQGLRYFLEKIHSLIEHQNDSFKLVVVGKEPPDWLIKLMKLKGVIYKGFVKDVKKELYQVSVCICPILSGSGTRLKVLEYMAMGKAVVSTSVGCEGLDLTDNVNVIIRNTKESFAEAVVELLADPRRSEALGKNAQEYVNANHNWAKIAKDLNKFYTRILK